MAKDGNGKAKKELKLTNEERLSIQNINLQRQLLEHQLDSQAKKLDSQQVEVTDTVNERLGIDLTQYSINLDTGLLKEAPREKQEKAAE